MRGSRAATAGAVVCGLVACGLSACASRGAKEHAAARTTAPLWSGLPPMSDQRDGAVGARLPGQRALVTGGQGGATCLSTAEIFDHATRTWSDGGTMSTPRGAHAMAALADGRVLVIGGVDHCSYGKALSSVDAFDPSAPSVASAWSARAPTNSPREGHSATLLTNGTVLVAGGRKAAGTEIYDPVADAWTPAGALAEPRFWHSAARLADGRVLVVGGDGGSGYLSSAELFDPATRTWKLVAPMSVAREAAAAVVLRDGRVLVVGGSDGASVRYSTTELYDPASGAWSAGPSMRVGRAEHSLALLPTGQALAIGGEASGRVELFDPASSAFLDFGFAITPRNSHATVPFDDGSVLVAGGQSAGIGVDSAELYSAAADGAPCKRNEECASFVCDPATKVCGRAPDAALPPADATPVVSPGGSTKSCRSASECATGFCVDGVCCDGPCTERCHSCALPTSPGKCTAEPTGVDLRGECGAALACAGTCGPGAACIGASAGTQCARSTCTGPSSGSGPAYCAATGAPCPLESAVPFECAPYGCDPAFGACRASCATTIDCAGGSICDLDRHVCVAAPTASPAAGDGGGCSHSGARGAGASPALLLGVLAALAALFERSARARRRATSAR